MYVSSRGGSVADVVRLSGRTVVVLLIALMTLPAIAIVLMTAFAIIAT